MRSASCVVLAIVPLVELPAQLPQQVADINAQPVPNVTAEESPMVAMGSWLYFVRHDPNYGVELFRTDAAGTVQLVADVAAGPSGSQPDALTVVGSLLYFTADDGLHGRELWRTDGTAAGTVLVADINPGPTGGAVPDAFWHQPMGVLGNVLVFPGSANGGLPVPWRSDGTAAGTFPLGAAATYPSQFTTVGTRLFFSSTPDLWVTDGTIAGTTRLYTFYGGCSELTAVGNTLFLSGAASWARGYELWKSDGTVAGTVEVKDIHPGSTVSESSYPYQLTDLGGVLLFTADDGAHGRELWKSDGTTAGTVMVADVWPGSTAAILSVGRRPMPVLGNVVLFAADDGAHGLELWKSDGTGPGTTLVRDLVPGLVGSLTARGLETTAVVANQLWFAADIPGLGAEVHTSNGTAAGTGLVVDLNGGAEGSRPRAFAAMPGGGAAFAADAGAGPALFRSQGTAPSTVLLADGYATKIDATGSAAPVGLVEWNGRLLLAADDGQTGFEPWRTDGTALGTQRLLDLNPGPNSSIWNGDPVAAYTTEWPTVRLGSYLYFMADPGNLPVHLYRTDGTASGTTLQRSFSPYSSGGPMGYALRGVAHRGALYFVAFDNGTWGLWRASGTPLVFVRLTALSHPFDSVVAAGDLIYALNGSAAIVQLWCSDGTPVGTRMLRMWTSTLNQRLELAAAGDRVLFVGNDAARGDELWSSDGTVAGTGPVLDLRPGTASSAPRSLKTFGDLVLFSADDGVRGREPFVTDGSAAGTVLLADVLPGSGASDPLDFAAGAGVAWFSAIGTSGHELWRTDGTPAGTARVASFPAPGGSSRGLANLATIGSRFLVFSGFQPAIGREPWVSDGTTAGTRLLGDLNPGSSFSQPSRPVLAGGDVYFTATDERHGSELWRVHLGASSQPLGDGCAPLGQQAPRLSVTDPVLGATADLEVTRAPANTPGLLALGLPGLTPVDLGYACDLWVAVPLPVLIAFASDAQGRWSLPAVPVPNAPILRGIPMAMQAAVVAPGPMLQLALSNGVRLTFGD